MVEDCVIVKFSGELAIKTFFVRQFFTKKLRSNILIALENNSIKVEKIVTSSGRFFVFSNDSKRSLKILKNVFGVHAVALAMHQEYFSLEDLSVKALDFFSPVLKTVKSFAVKSKRDKRLDFSSLDANIKIGAVLKEKFSEKIVDLTNPDKTFFVEIFQKNVFFYVEEQRALGGLPIGVQGKVALFLSGKKEDLFAAFLMLKRGCRIFPIFETGLDFDLKKLEKFNSYQEFVPTEIGKTVSLVKDFNLKAFVVSDTVIDSKKFKEFDLLKKIPVYRPLLFLSEKELTSLEAVFE